jgi:hypothetical protein
MGTSLEQATQVLTDQGLRTQYGLNIPPGARIAAYVRSTGVQTDDSAFLATNIVTTLAQGLARVRAGFGDYVICLPGHAENVADATTISNALLSGTRIIGVGVGSLKPTFTWTATASSIAVSVANVLISGCLFKVDGIDAVVNAFNITGADFHFVNNEVETSTTSKAAAIVMTLGTGAHRALVSNNLFRGLTSAANTDGILVSGAITDAEISNNKMVFAGTTTNGLIRVTGVAIGLRVFNNIINNAVALSVAGINYANVAITGFCYGNLITVLSTGAVSAGVTGITVGGTNNLTGYFNNYTVNDPNKSGLLTPAVDT